MSTIIILEAIDPEEGHFSQKWQTGRLAGLFYNHSMVILISNVTLFDPALTTIAHVRVKTFSMYDDAYTRRPTSLPKKRPPL